MCVCVCVCQCACLPRVAAQIMVSSVLTSCRAMSLFRRFGASFRIQVKGNWIPFTWIPLVQDLQTHHSIIYASRKLTTNLHELTTDNQQDATILIYLLLISSTLCRWPSGAQMHLCTGRPPTECDDTGCCIIQFWPPDDGHNSVRNM